MGKTEKVERFTRVKSKPGSLLRKEDSAKVKITETITDQNRGLQQLYENRKVKPLTKRKEITTDLKKVRHTVSEKMDKLLGKDSSSTKQQESTKIKKNG